MSLIWKFVTHIFGIVCLLWVFFVSYDFYTHTDYYDGYLTSTNDDDIPDLDKISKRIQELLSN